MWLADGQKAKIDQRSLAAAGMDHAYALTGHGFQGATVDRILVAMSSTETLADQKSFYVAVSQARETMMLVTDNAQDLSDRLTRQTTPALEAWLAAQLDRSQQDQNRDLERPPTGQKPEPTKEVEQRKPEQAKNPPQNRPKRSPRSESANDEASSPNWDQGFFAGPNWDQT